MISSSETSTSIFKLDPTEFSEERPLPSRVKKLELGFTLAPWPKNELNISNGS